MDQFRHTKKFMRSVLGLLCKFLDRAGFEVDIFIPVRPYLLMRTELASFITTFLQGCFLRKCHLTSILANTSDKTLRTNIFFSSCHFRINSARIVRHKWVNGPHREIRTNQNAHNKKYYDRDLRKVLGMSLTFFLDKLIDIPTTN